MSTTLEYLYDTYGPLMTMDALAKTLDRTPNGLRAGLSHTSEFSIAVNAAKKKIGRRVYFRSEVIAEIIDDDDIY